MYLTVSYIYALMGLWSSFKVKTIQLKPQALKETAIYNLNTLHIYS